tara:strand:+ start:668 stop:1885 length:1218 start_codon:yes stop_codon:yes gene_type:complete
LNFLQNESILNIRLYLCSFVIILLGFTAPLASNGLVIILSISLIIILHTYRIITPMGSQIKFLTYLFLILFAWSFTSNIWGPENAYWKSVKTFGLIFIGILFSLNIYNLDYIFKKRLLYSTIISCIIMIIIFLIESLSNGIIISNLIDIHQSQLLEKVARGSVILSILTTPITIYFYTLNKKLGLIFFIICLTSIISLPMTASLVGVLLGLFFAFLVFLFGNKFCNFILVVFSTYILFAPFISSKLLTIDNIRQNDIFLSSPHEHRIGIWEYSSKATLNYLPLGLGFDSSRHLGGRNDKIEQMRKNENYAPDALPLHPHNAVIQIWLELGAVGIFLFLVLFFYIIKIINRIKNLYKKAIGMSLIGSIAPPLLLNFGIWQAWWLSSIMLCISLTLTIEMNTPKIRK